MINPYSTPTADLSEECKSHDSVSHLRIVWAGYIGTWIAGVVFGLIGGPIGIVVGAVLAGVVGLLPFGLLSFLGASQGRMALVLAAGFCGAATGGLSLLALLGGRITAIVIVPSVLGFLGGLVGGLAASGRYSQQDDRRLLRHNGSLSDAQLLRDALLRTNHPAQRNVDE